MVCTPNPLAAGQNFIILIIIYILFIILNYLSSSWERFGDHCGLSLIIDLLFVLFSFLNVFLKILIPLHESFLTIFWCTENHLL